MVPAGRLPPAAFRFSSRSLAGAGAGAGAGLEAQPAWGIASSAHHYTASRQGNARAAALLLAAVHPLESRVMMAARRHNLITGHKPSRGVTLRDPA